MNNIDWYEYIIENHFKERNYTPPLFFTPKFVAFKLPPHATPPTTKHHIKLLSTKTAIYNKAKTMTTSELMALISDASFIHF
jgi:hypothetical protein